MALTLLALSSPARAYEFEIEATTTGQGYQLRWVRSGEDVLLNRRRFTQSLSLHIWDILAPRRDPGYPDRAAQKAPFELYFTSSLRFDHDFGSFTQGSVTYGMVPQTDKAKDIAPQLENNDLQLDILWAYIGGRGLGGLVDFELGRQFKVDELEWYAFDGLTTHVNLPWHLTLEGHGGLLVRGDVPGLLGTPTHEPDGTSSSFCRTYEQIAMSWSDPFDPNSEPKECKQKKQVMPTFGAAIETRGVRWMQARLAYRRTVSRTPTGLYPQDAMTDLIPDWGVNEEQLFGTLRFNFMNGHLVPWAAARWNFLVAQIDEAQLGVRLAAGDHAFTPEYVYSYPSFDGDSIFLVFTQFGYQDFRLNYDFWPGHGRLRTFARGWVRTFKDTVEAGDLAPGASVAKVARAAGGGAGARLQLGTSGRVRLDVQYEDGFGGRRVGGDLSGAYRLRSNLELEGRGTVYQFDEDLLGNLHGVTAGAQAGGRWVLTDGIAIHLLTEENFNRFYTSQFRIFAILDLAFRPEL